MREEAINTKWIEVTGSLLRGSCHANESRGESWGEILYRCEKEVEEELASTEVEWRTGLWGKQKENVESGRMDLGPPSL